MRFDCSNLTSGTWQPAQSFAKWQGASDITAASKTILKALLLITASAGLSGCVYDVGLGYASDGYYDGYGCDPYGGYEVYYDCDYGQGFANIGFGSGYHDSYHYPGHGFFLFDNVRRRYPMRDHHRRYWSEKRQNYFRDQRGRDYDDRCCDGSPRGYSKDAKSGVYGGPERMHKQDDAIRQGRARWSERRGSGEGKWHEAAKSSVCQREPAQVRSRTENPRPIPQARERTEPVR